MFAEILATLLRTKQTLKFFENNITEIYTRLEKGKKMIICKVFEGKNANAKCGILIFISPFLKSVNVENRNENINERNSLLMIPNLKLASSTLNKGRFPTTNQVR